MLLNQEKARTGPRRPATHSSDHTRFLSWHRTKTGRKAAKVGELGYTGALVYLLLVAEADGAGRVALSCVKDDLLQADVSAEELERSLVYIEYAGLLTRYKAAGVLLVQLWDGWDWRPRGSSQYPPPEPSRGGRREQVVAAILEAGRPVTAYELHTDYLNEYPITSIRDACQDAADRKLVAVYRGAGRRPSLYAPPGYEWDDA